MKAIRVSAYGGPSVLKVEEIPAPHPGATQERIGVPRLFLQIRFVSRYLLKKVTDLPSGQD